VKYSKVNRRTVDLSGYPDPVVIYLRATGSSRRPPHIS